MSVKRRPHSSFFHRHSLSIVSGCILALWIVLYTQCDPAKHLGSFFGNAIADWTGTLVIVLATKYLYEKGSSESRRPPQHWLNPIKDFLENHSLTIFLVLTGIAWILLYIHMSSESRWGQVVGNIVSEWTQIAGLVILTKRLMESKSKESGHSK